MKVLTLPWLELMASVIGAQLANHAELTLTDVHFWSDSYTTDSLEETSEQIRTKSYPILELSAEGDIAQSLTIRQIY